MNNNIRNALAFCDDGFQPGNKAIKSFIRYTEKGKAITWSSEEWYDEYCQLRIGHNMFSGAQERIWLEGYFAGEISLIELAIDYLTRASLKPAYWEQKKPAYNKLESLWYCLHGGPFPFTSKVR